MVSSTDAGISAATMGRCPPAEKVELSFSRAGCKDDRSRSGAIYAVTAGPPRDRPAQRPPLPALVIFDCDGVLIDSEVMFGRVLGECLIAAEFPITMDEAMVLGFAGVQARPDGLALKPQLLPRWKQLVFPLQWRGRKLRVWLEPESVRLLVESGPAPLKITLDGGAELEAHPHRQYVAERTRDGWAAWKERR